MPVMMPTEAIDETQEQDLSNETENLTEETQAEETTGAPSSPQASSASESLDTVEQSQTFVPDPNPFSDAPVPTLESLQSQLNSLREQLTSKAQLEADIAECSSRVEKLAAEVMSAESEVKSAQGELKTVREKYEIAVRELRELICDQVAGQGRLNFDQTSSQPDLVFTPNSSPTQAEVDAVAKPVIEQALAQSAVVQSRIDEHLRDPISVLSQSAMKELVGDDEFLRLKEIEEPIGMTDREVEMLDAAECGTIGKLEAKMREDAYWHASMGRGWGESKTNKLINSLRIFRQKYPQLAD